MIKIDETNFPDVYLYGQDYGRHGVIMDEDIPKITYISVSDDIKSLKGIEHFTALTTLFRNYILVGSNHSFLKEFIYLLEIILVN